MASLNAVPASSHLHPPTLWSGRELWLPWAFPSLNAPRFLLGQVVHWAPRRAVPGELLSLAERGIWRRALPRQQSGPGREGRHAPRGRRRVRHQVEPVRLPLKTGVGGPVPTGAGGRRFPRSPGLAIRPRATCSRPPVSLQGGRGTGKHPSPISQQGWLSPGRWPLLPVN